MAGSDSLLFEVLLVIFLGWVESRRLLNLRHDGSLEDPFLFKDSLRVARFFLLLSIVKEDRGAVLRAAVRPLAIQLGWVVALPESGQQLKIRNLLGIELDFHRFR